jgi:hypothetical protein
MSPATGRTTSATPGDGRRRLDVARRYLEMAETVNDDDADPVARTVAVGLAVLAGIAASDSACIFRLGRYSRGQDHAEATTLLTAIEPGGQQVARDLRVLLGLKDKAHYGFGDIGAPEAKRALRNAANLVAFAQALLR